jgi:CheY-like chemotaxis protein
MGGIFFRTKENLGYTLSRVEIKKDKKRQETNPKISPSVLIADDDAESAQLLQTVMRDFGFETTLAFDGKDAFRQISSKGFDLIFLDICMPELTGPEVLSKIEDAKYQSLQKCKKWKTLPVITYSSHNQNDLDIPEEKGFHIVGHWQKPIMLKDLKALATETIGNLGISHE